MDVRHKFLESLDKWGDEETILDEGRRYSASQLARVTVWMRNRLRAEDDSETGNVAILLPTCAAFIPAFYGSIFAGKIPVPINPTVPAAELAWMLDHIGARIVLTAAPLRPVVEALPASGAQGVRAMYLDEELGQLGFGAKLAMALQCRPSKLKAALREPPNETACMLFSSGTTGKPKAVMLSHAALIANHEAIRLRYDFGPRDTVLCALPLFHSFGLCVFHLAFWSGARIAMHRKFQPRAVLRDIQNEGVTIMLVVPQIYQMLLRNADMAKTDWSRMRLCLSGGGPAAAALREDFERATGKRYHQGYGLTEYSPVVALETPDRAREGSVGPLLPGVEACILDSSGKTLPLGQDGEICVRGPSAMSGYYKQPEATRAMIDAEGWIHTGDCGHLDSDGFLYVSGRAKDIIIVAGENVHPLEIEEALLAHPDVAEAAVIGVPDATHGEAPYAYVVSAPDSALDEKILKAHLRDRLAPYKIPKGFSIVGELPKNALGKILKTNLKALWEQSV
ncbi:MAG: Long-chain-fatty-acid--CoA ligase [candidate division BRC1 bacterium ADurb.BinA364]|nr:MAG: Long-chain-fatty-acid--CoA ligase [candidate division BRC1 bacterium ADurb.BinA364]